MEIIRYHTTAMEKYDGYKEIVFNAIIGFNIIPAKSNKKLNVFKNLFFHIFRLLFNVKIIITQIDKILC